MTTPPLAPAEMELLEFERLTWASPGRRDAAIRTRFNHSPSRYAQRLQAVLEHPAALVYDPTHVRRLIRLRDARRTARSTR